MNNLPQDIQRFLYGQHFADGLRMSVLILFPSLAASYLGHFDIGLTMSIGALCVSICDTPGPAHHKRNAMLICCAFIFLISLLTGFLRMNVYVMGASLTFFAFFFAMFTMYGVRAGLVGTAVLLLMALQMDKELEPLKILQNCLFLTGGALWYSAVSILILQLFPLRSAQRALGECIRETAEYLSLRGLLYDTNVPLDEVYTRLIAQQVILSDKQNEVRELLFKNQKIVSQSTRKARAMVLTFDEVVDLYEKISASHIDYQAIREQYALTEVLQTISITISRLAEILDSTGAAIQYNISPKDRPDISIAMNALADAVTCTVDDDRRPMLDGLLTNIQNMYRVVTDLQHYFTDDYPILKSDNITLEHTRFVSHQDFDLKLFRYNLSFDSLTFRHAVRMALACLTGFLLSKLVMHGHHTYWLLITIIFVLKPAFSLTRERNRQRILGTVIGGIIGVAVLVFIQSTNILFALMFTFMLITYSFQRHRYMIAMIFMTPYILILFHFMHVGLVEVAEERVVDTIVGSIIALIAGYLILPDWESGQIRANMSHMLHANYRYLRSIRDSLSGMSVPVTEYKLIRKDVYISTSNLSAAIQRMKSEPSSTRKNTKEIQQFSILNHLLSSGIAAAKESIKVSSDQNRLIWTEKALTILKETISYVDENKKPAPPADAKASETIIPKDPFESIYKTSTKIEQITQTVAF